MKREAPWLVFALLYPTALAWVYFVALDHGAAKADPVQQTAYGVGKLVQLSLPILLVWWWDGRLPRPSRPRAAGLGIGLAFGLVVVAGMLALYLLWLRHTPLFERTPAEVGAKLTQFGLATPAGYLLFCVFVSVPHALMEEFYWRWFVFGRLDKNIGFGRACLLSSLGFMAHHVIVLAAYLPGFFWAGVVPLSLCVAVGGAVWAWLYRRTGSIYASWLSHILVDLGLFLVGYFLLRDSLFV